MSFDLLVKHCHETPYELHCSNYLSAVSPKMYLFEVLFFVNSDSGGGAHTEVHAAPRPCIGLLYVSRVIVRMEKLVE
jgi:hypothetical protein